MFDNLATYLNAALTSRRADRQQRLNHIGIAVAVIDGRHIVSAVLDGSPAAQAGLQRGDHLLSVNGAPYHPVYSFNPEPPATPQPDNRIFELTFARRGEQQEVVTRTVFNNLFDSYRSAVEPSVRQFNLGNKLVGHVRLWGVSRNANDLITLRRIVEDFRETTGLIVDLRNAAGYLSREHLELFLPGSRNDYYSSPYYSSPMALIINQTTTGPAEAFAGELARLDRVTSTGAPTPGGMQAELPITWPLDSSTPNDPQFETALALLGGLI